MSVEGKRGERHNFAAMEVNSAQPTKPCICTSPYGARLVYKFVSCGRWKDPDTVFAYLQTRQETVNLNAVSLQTQEREAVEVTLPISMHAGQIFLLTKLLTATDLRFYDFEAGAPVERWRSGPSGSS